MGTMSGTELLGANAYLASRGSYLGAVGHWTPHDGATGCRYRRFGGHV